MESVEGFGRTANSHDCAVAAVPDRRSEPRTTALLRLGKLVVGGEQRLCMIRNVSSAGAMLRLYQPVAADARIEIEITPDCPVAASVVWAEGDLAGIQFDTPIDVVASLRGEVQDRPYRRVARTPRLRLRRPVRMCTAEAETQVILCDISLQGAGIETPVPLSRNSEIALFAEGLPAISGRVRWCREGRAGVEFDLPLGIDVLGGWLGN